VRFPAVTRRDSARDAVRRRRSVTLCLVQKSAKRDASPTLSHAFAARRSLALGLQNARCKVDR